MVVLVGPGCLWCKQRHPVDDGPGPDGACPCDSDQPTLWCDRHLVCLRVIMWSDEGRNRPKRYHPDQSKTLQIVTQSTFSLMRWTSTGSQHLVFWCALHLYIHMDLSNVPRGHLTGFSRRVHQAGDGGAAFSTSKALVTFTLEGSTTKIE